MVDAVESVAETTPEINFDDAFARLANLEQSAAGDTGTEEPEKKPEEAPAADAPATDAPKEEAPAAETAPAEAAPAEAPKAEAPKPETDPVLERLAQLVKEQPAAPAAPATQAPAAPAEQARPLYTEDEVAYLQNYQKEWPDVHRAEALIRRGEHTQLLNYVFNELAKEIRPLMETVQVLSQRTFLGDLTQKVEDYDTVRDQVIDWVGTQPAYLQAAYNHVIENGSVDEIADLIGRYKREVGASAAPAAGAAPAPKKVDTELPPATKQAAAALAPVSSKRTVVPQAVDPTDFEAAFSAFASKM